MSEPLSWDEGAPRSPRFGDVYFQPGEGLAETRAVFLEGCGLPAAWRGRDRFTVGELGFGTGLNILALLELWGRTREPGARLYIVSVEAYPISREDAAAALSVWPEMAQLAEPLLAQWPKGRRGLHRIDLPFDAVLDLLIGEASEMLEGWRGRADAWFLDGFAPSKNPGMWRDELLALVAARSAPGARAATFTVAGQVRRGLAAAGFQVERAPGFGRKKERLEARLPGEPAPSPAPRVAVIGAGIAGASLVRALRALGCEPALFAGRPGASANPVALAAPRLDAGGGPVARLSAAAHARAAALYRRTPDAVVSEGALELERQPRDAARFQALSGWDGFDPGALRPVSSQEAAAWLGEAEAPPGLFERDALVVSGALVLQAWLEGVETGPRVAALRHSDDGWILLDEAGAGLGTFDAVCLAAGWEAAALAGLSLEPVRGQCSWTTEPEAGLAAGWGGYAVPLSPGVLFGATHDRGRTDSDPSPEDDARNLESLRKARPALAARLEGKPLRSRASVRATTPDRLPLAGEVGDGLYTLGGLGGRGFSFAPLLAEEVAAAVMDAPRPLPRDLAAVVDPGRFGRASK
jgi:tRNA 5-methylaminomethyl-2-thiouridine biosynthesis bifunctional protein